MPTFEKLGTANKASSHFAIFGDGIPTNLMAANLLRPAGS